MGTIKGSVEECNLDRSLSDPAGSAPGWGLLHYGHGGGSLCSDVEHLLKQVCG